MSFLQLTYEKGNEQTLKVYAAGVLPHVDKPAGTILSVDKRYPNCHERRRFKFIATSAGRQETYVCARLPQWSS